MTTIISDSTNLSLKHTTCAQREASAQARRRQQQRRHFSASVAPFGDGDHFCHRSTASADNTAVSEQVPSCLAMRLT